MLIPARLVAGITSHAATTTRQPVPAVIVVGHGGLVPLLVSALSAPDRARLPVRSVLRVPTLAEARDQLRRLVCDEVIIAEPLAVWPAAPLTDVRGRPVRLLGPGEAVERLWRRIPLDLVANDPRLAELATGVADGAAYRRLKRALDLMVGLAGGLAVIWLVPLLALLIWLDSPGPVVIRRPRIGKDGRRFDLYHFRTTPWPVAEIHREWTWVGRGLRATRLDRLPVLWNLLAGDLSLVGPEALPPEATTRGERELPGAAWRLRVPPGLTGWAQVRRRHGDGDKGVRTAIEHDLYYIRHASIGFDLRILVVTVGHGVRAALV